MNPFDAEMPLSSSEDELSRIRQKILSDKNFIQYPDIAMFFDTLPARVDSFMVSSDVASLLIVLQIMSASLPVLNNWREDRITEIVNSIIRCLIIESMQPFVCDVLNQLHDCSFLRGLIVKCLCRKRNASENVLKEQVGLILTRLERKEIAECSRQFIGDDAYNIQTSADNVILRTPRYLEISFLPPSISEQWILSTDSDEVKRSSCIL